MTDFKKLESFPFDMNESKWTYGMCSLIRSIAIFRRDGVVTPSCDREAISKEFWKSGLSHGLYSTDIKNLYVESRPVRQAASSASLML